MTPSDLAAAISKLEVAPTTFAAAEGSATLPLGVLFTSVSGLKEIGDSHSGVINDNGAESQQAFANRFSNIAAQLRQNLVDVIDADTNISQLIGAVGLRSDGAELLTKNHVADIVDTETTPFAITPPGVAHPGSLPALAAQYSATNYGVPTSMTGHWDALSAKVANAADSLNGVIADLDSSADTQAIANAITTIRTLQSAGAVFAANTTTMGATTTNLGTGSLALGQQVMAAAKAHAILLATRPDAAAAFEQAYLASYPATVAAALPPAIPPITQLLPSALDPSGLSAGGVGSIGESAGARLNAWQDMPLPSVVQEAMEHIGMAEQARMRSPQQLAEEFQRAGMDDLNALVAGATPTSTASVAAPSMPPTLNSGAHSGLGGPGVATPGAPPTGTVPQINPTSVGAAGVPTTAAGAASRPGGVGTGGVGHGLGTAVPGSMAGAGRGVGNTGGTAGFGSHGRAGAPGTSGISGGYGTGGRGLTGSGSMPGAPGLPGASGMSGSQGALGGAGPHGAVGKPTPHAAPGAGYAGAAGHASSAGHGGNQSRGGVPMGGMMGAGRGGNQHGGTSNSVRGIKTSAVEREGNLKALLGEGPEVIPGVIGAWVREPRPDR
ncbi:hypothetical protein [Corynebacterium pilosum]|nr:hypothetical protein [Corynebacterium pilosum]